MTVRPSAEISRRVEWTDTDAAGHYHHAAVGRWVEAAEAVLHEEFGLPELFERLPRVRYEVDYLAKLWFRDPVDIRIEVAEVGRTSIRYEFEVRTGDTLAARGAMITVYAEPTDDVARPLPDEVRAALTPG